MIVIDQPQNLGRRTMFLLLAQRTTIGFVVFILSIILAFLGPTIASVLTGLMTLGGSADNANVTNLSNAIASFAVMVLLASVILILVGMIIGLIQYRNHIFILGEFNLKFRRGIINKTEISIPYRQIQDVNLVRNLLHRIFGVSRLLMITAGLESVKTHNVSDTIFDPIDADLALEIQNFLEHRTGVQVVESVKEAATSKISPTGDLEFANEQPQVPNHE